MMIKNYPSYGTFNYVVLSFVFLLASCGGDSDSGGATTDTQPNAFIFTDQTDVPVSTLITSNTITVSEITDPASITVSSGEYSINGGSFASTASTVSNNDTVAVRHTSSSNNSTVTNTTLTIGGVSDIFSSTTTAGPNSLLWDQGNWDESNWN